MRLIHRDRILDFMGRYPDSAPSLKAWTQNMELNVSKHFVQLRQTFASADYVPPFTVLGLPVLVWVIFSPLSSVKAL